MEKAFFAVYVDIFFVDAEGVSADGEDRVLGRRTFCTGVRTRELPGVYTPQPPGCLSTPRVYIHLKVIFLFPSQKGGSRIEHSVGVLCVCFGDAFLSLFSSPCGQLEEWLDVCLQLEELLGGRETVDLLQLKNSEKQMSR